MVTDPLGNQATTAKDPAGRVVSESDFAGNQVNYHYEDGRGNLTKQVERDKKPDGTYVERTTLFTYNGLGSVEKTIENSGTPQEKTTTFLYDGEGKLTASLEGENRKLEHTYDASGRRISTTRFLDNGGKAETHYTYVGTTSLIRTIQDGNGNATTYDYDSRNRLKTTVYPDGTTQEFTYDAAGNVLTEKQRSGTVVANTFDDLGRLTHRAVQRASGVLGAAFEDYGYDSQSRLKRGETDGSVVEFGYDSMGRRTWEKQNGKTVSYAYDVLSNLKTITYPNGRVVEREHDLMGQVKKISIGGVPIATFDFSGRRLAGKTYGNGDVTTYTYDLPGYRPITIEAKNKNDAIISHFAYGYDLYTLKTHEKRIHDGGKGDSYTYDALNRIKTVKVNSTQPENPNNATFEVNKDYSIDKVDNLLKITENRDNVLTEILAERDANSTKLNQYTSFNGKVMAYDANGNLSAKGNQNFSYDFKNRLVKVDQPGNVVEYGYDIFGRQTHKRINASTHRLYYYAGDQKIEERDSDNNVTRQFVYGNGIDEIVRIDRNESGTMIPYYFHLNEIGSVTSITDNNGALVERVNYDTFGKPTFTDFKTDPQNPQQRTTSIIGNDVLFQGREYDTDIVLYNYRARYYDPEMGRFLQTDPIGYEDSMNLCQAMNQSSMNFLDPFGLIKVHYQHLGTFAEDPSLVPNSKPLTAYPYGDIYSDLRQKMVSEAGLVNSRLVNYIKHSIVPIGNQFRAEFEVSMETYVFAQKDYSESWIMKHEHTHIIGDKLLLLEMLFGIRPQEDILYSSIGQCEAEAKKIANKWDVFSRTVQPSYWPSWSDFIDVLNFVPGLISNRLWIHNRYWNAWAKKWDERIIDYDINNFELVYKSEKNFVLSRYKKKYNY